MNANTVQDIRKLTNNRMELMAVITGLEALTRPCEVEVISDSKYVTDAFNQHWVDGWLKRNWKGQQQQSGEKCRSVETSVKSQGASSGKIYLG